MGLPIVGCKCCPSVNTIIHHGKNDFLCDDTSEDIAAHLRILMSDTELRKKMGQQAREDMKQYAPEVIWKRWDELLKKIHAGEPISNKPNFLLRKWGIARAMPHFAFRQTVATVTAPSLPLRPS